DRPQPGAGQVLDRPRQGEGAVHEDRVERVPDPRKRLRRPIRHARLVVEVERERLEPLRPEPRAILLPATGGEDPPATPMETARRVEIDAGGTARDEDGALPSLVRHAGER